MDILDITLNDLKEYLKTIGEPSFRANQVFEWVGKGVKDFNEMKNIPIKTREKLKEDFDIFAPEILIKQESKDKTVKYLFELKDKKTVETVVMDYNGKKSICISSQVGCRMGCRFCASTLSGLERNLTASEMLGQMIKAQQDLNIRLSSVVIMGMGEPLDNYDNLMVYLKNVNEEKLLNLGYRHITVSSCGLCENIRRLADEGLPVNLALSLHAPNDELRKTIMPVSNKYSLKEVTDACDYFFKKTSRRVTYEYSLIDGVNDSSECAKELSKLLKGKNCHVNLIGINPVRERNFKRSKNIAEFMGILTKNGVTATLRRELGTDIDAACGQLRNKNRLQ